MSSFLPHRIRYALVCGVLALSLFGAGCSGGRSAPKAERNENGWGESAAAETPPVAVTTASAIAREVPSFFQATGSLVADETSDVAPQTSGQVVATPVDVGAFVRQGDVIARLNDRDARLRLQQAEAGVGQAIAGVRQAEARLGLRAGGNFEASSIPEVRAAGSNLEQALAQLRLAQLDGAQAEYERAQQRLQRAQSSAQSAQSGFVLSRQQSQNSPQATATPSERIVTANASSGGTISVINAQVGAQVRAGQPLATLRVE